MKNKKIFILLIFVLIIVIISIILIINNFNLKNSSQPPSISEYTPEEEISSEQLRKTIVTLYYVSNDTNSIKSEGKLVDSVSLIQNPYKTITELLFLPLQSSSLKSPFPENVVLNNIFINGSCVTLDFSEEILNYENDEAKFNIINCLLNSLCELNEVNSIKILVNNNSVSNFDEEYFS